MRTNTVVDASEEAKMKLREAELGALWPREAAQNNLGRAQSADMQSLMALQLDSFETQLLLASKLAFVFSNKQTKSASEGVLSRIKRKV